MKNRIIRLILFVAFVGVSLTAVLASISMTQTGSRWFVNWIIKTNGIPLSLKTIEGRLIDTLSIQGLVYKDKSGNEIKLNRLVFNWTPASLIHYQLQVNRIELDGLSYQASDTDSNEPFSIPELSLPSFPLAINVDELTIQNMRLSTGDNEQIIKQLNSSLEMNDSGLSIQLIELNSNQQHVNGHVSLSNNKQTEIDSQFNWTGEYQQKPAQAVFTIKGKQDGIAVALKLNSLIEANIDARLNLKDQPYYAKIKGELDTSLTDSDADNFRIDSPVAFDLSGDTDQFFATLSTHAQLPSGDAFSLNMETEAIIPGNKFNKLNLNINWQILPDVVENTYLSLKGQGDFEYADYILTLDHELQSPSIFNVKGNINFANELINLSSQWNEIEIPFSEDKAIRFHAGLLNARGKMQALLVSLQTDYALRNMNSVEEITYNSINSEGEFDLLNKKLIGELKGTLNPSVPESIHAYIDTLDAIDFVISSEKDTYNINANASSKSEKLGPINIDLAAQWDDSVLNVNSLTLELLEGKLVTNGSINFKEKLKGSFSLIGQNLNAGVINPDLTSQLNLNAGVSLLETEKGLSTDLDLTSLSGVWRGYPLNGSARMAYIDNIIQIEKLNIKSGNNTIAASLDIDKSLYGYIDLSLQDLSLFSSDISGVINGHMTLSGHIDTPIVEGKLNGNNIIFNDIRLVSFNADSNIDLRPQQHSTIKLQLTSLKYQGYLFDEVLINGQGLTESHEFDISATGSKFDIKALIIAGLNNNLWSGQFKQLDVKQQNSDSWKLSEPSLYNWHTQKHSFNLQKTCLSQSTANICFVAKGSEHDISGDINIERLPLKYFEPLLVETVLLKGDVSGSGKFNLLGDNFKFVSSFEGNNAQLGAAYDDEPEYIDVNVVSVKVKADNGSREFDFKFHSNNYFDISVTGDIQSKGKRALQGKLALVFEDITWLENFEPTLKGSHGKFQALMTATGTTHQPEVEGSFSLQNGLLNVAPIGLSLNKIEGQLQSYNEMNQVKLNSVFSSDEKKLLMDGFISLNADKNYPYEFKLSGDEFPIVRTADMTIDVSPDLSLTGTKDLHYVKGQLNIPLMDILISSIPESAVSISPDVVIIQSKQADAKLVTNGDGGNDYVKDHIDLDLNVILKPDIHFKGMGLDTRLTGDLKITKPVGLYQPRAEGQVSLTEGSYAAYGQNLKIDNGRLLFAGPLDNPAINLRAYRPKLAVKAGVSISGDIKRPKLSLFSEPTQTEADTLSYLITGGPISGASGGEASLIAQAALSLGTNESSVLTNQIQNMFGLDDFSVGGGNTVASTSVSASKRLSQKLTFKSSFNPFDQLWAFFLNYKLTDNWSVQTESGLTQGADIIYSIESNTFQDLYERFWELIQF